MTALKTAEYIRLQAAVASGDYEAALAHANYICPIGTIPPYSPLALQVGLDLTEAAVRLGQRDEARRHVAAMREANLPALSPRQALLVAGATAIAAAKDDATALFEIALATPDAATWPFEQARIQLAYGEHLRRNKGSVADARRLLKLALETFDRLGATPWSARSKAELKALPGTRPDAANLKTLVLTPQEREVAMLAASGLTNKEIGKRLFLSDRTVSAHLYRVYPKLGITSRAALRDALTQLGE